MIKIEQIPYLLNNINYISDLFTKKNTNKIILGQLLLLDPKPVDLSKTRL